MRDSLLILGVFLAAVALARLGCLPDFLGFPELTAPALLVFMFLAGVSVGSGRYWLNIFTKSGLGILLLPLATTVGTLVGAACAALFLSTRLWDCMAVGTGFGYYSLSSIFIGQYRGSELGTVALIANVLRELAALVLMPILIRKFGPMAGISAAGATSMDTTLPVIGRYAGPGWTLPALAHGIILDMSVPFWVTFFCSL